MSNFTTQGKPNAILFKDNNNIKKKIKNKTKKLKKKQKRKQ